jgi:hypothetical protein
MGFDVATFHSMLEGWGRFVDLWEGAPIPKQDVNGGGGGEACLGSRSLDAAGVLGLVLHYLGLAMLEVSLQQVFALTPSTCPQYLCFAKQSCKKLLGEWTRHVYNHHKH